MAFPADLRDRQVDRQVRVERLNRGSENTISGESGVTWDFR